MQDHIVYAGVTNSSFALASQDLAKLAAVVISAKQVERVTKRIGLERCVERDAAVAAYQALPLVERKGIPPSVTPPPGAVVGTDGGRMQILDRSAPAVAAVAGLAPPPVDDAAPPPADDTAPPPADDAGPQRGRSWREDKIGLLMALTSTVSAHDPCPEIPEGFLDPTRMGKLVRELRKGVPVAEEPAGAAPDPVAEAEALQPPQPSLWKPPTVPEKRLRGSRLHWPLFGPLGAQVAWAMGLFGSARRAFLGDGAENNWTIWRCFFSSFVPILDFIHALSYVYAAAPAGQERVAGWKCSGEWIGWVWQGQVEHVLAALRVRQAELGEPQAGDQETHPRTLVTVALGSLENKQQRMRSDEYRRAGLPSVSSYGESAVKQFNQRAKGTEKFGGGRGGRGHPPVARRSAE